MKTSCKKCIFAQFNDYDQTGCLLNRLDIYKKQNRANLVVDENDYNKQHYVIETICKACTQANPEQIIPDDIADIIKSRIIPKVDVILIGSIENVKKVLPFTTGYNIISYAKSGEASPKEYFEINSLNPGILYKVRLNKDYDFDYIDDVVFQSKANYVVIVDVDKEYPLNIVDMIKRFEAEDLLSFCAILPIDESLNGLVINPKVARLFNGHKAGSLIDQLKQIPDYERNVMSWTEKPQL